MKITFLGVGNAFTTQEYWQSNMLIEIDGKNLLLDCGSDCRFSMAEVFPKEKNPVEKINAVYISHIHADHIGGMEWLGFSTFFNPNLDKPALILAQELENQLWGSLKGGMSQLNDRPNAIMKDFFNVYPINNRAGEVFQFQGVSFRLVPAIHVKSIPTKYSFGLFFTTSSNKKIFITTDSIFNPDAPEYNDADIIFQDCETSDSPSGVHAHYNELVTLPEEIKKKMWLYHYSPGGEKKFDAVKDGFAGFIKKGQEFNE